jgi:hypothetical protein
MSENTPWVVAIVLVVFDESQGQVVKSVYPPQMVNKISILHFISSVADSRLSSRLVNMLSKILKCFLCQTVSLLEVTTPCNFIFVSVKKN